jgi:hypothetical protein
VQEPIYSPALVKALEGKDVVLARPGQHHTLFLTRDGALLSCGRPTYGRLGRAGVDTASDEAMAEPAAVDLGAATIAGLAAGMPRSTTCSAALRSMQRRAHEGCGWRRVGGERCNQR